MKTLLAHAGIEATLLQRSEDAVVFLSHTDASNMLHSADAA